MAKRLTEVGVQNQKSDPNKRLEIPDALVPGLYLVVQPSGRKSWAVRFRWHGRPAKHTLGSYPAWKLEGAREDARLALQAVARGEDPRAAKREAEADTVAAVVADWLKRDQAGNRSHNEVKRLFEREVLPKWRDRAITSITRRDCLDLIDSIADRGAVTAARRAHAHLHRLLRWSVGRGVIKLNPMADAPKPGVEVKRDRVLSDAELAEVWKACDIIGFPFGPAIKLLILTGARRDEIGALQRPEVDGDVIRLTGNRTKTGEARNIPLSPIAAALLGGQPRIDGRAGYVFTTTGKTAVSGWSKAKTLLDRGVVDARRTAAEAAGVDPEAIEPLPAWRLHDLRRTVATGLQRLGFRLEVIEAVLGHVSGSRAGVVGVYQRHKFEDELRAALLAWADHVARLVDEEPAKVINLRGAS